MEQSNKNIANTDTLTSERDSNLAKEDGETQQVNINDENMQDIDDQLSSEKYVVQPEDMSHAPTKKCLKNGRFEFEKYVDVGFIASKSLSNSFIYYIFSHEMSYFENKYPNNICSVWVREYKEQK
ncbi:uncharacterized protein TNCV_3595641 [Trichonephila clavipes]|nr:uncharacterized protein TNCV_3595641 [Trichonephila clavipes]